MSAAVARVAFFFFEKEKKRKKEDQENYSLSNIRLNKLFHNEEREKKINPLENVHLNGYTVVFRPGV